MPAIFLPLILSLTTLTGLNSIQAQSASMLSKDKSQSCEVQFETINKGESPWGKLKFVKNFKENVSNVDNAEKLKNFETLPEMREWLAGSESSTNVSSIPHTGREVFKNALNSHWVTFTTVKYGTGEPVARYTNSWVNAEQGKVRLEVCKAI